VEKLTSSQEMIKLWYFPWFVAADICDQIP